MQRIPLTNCADYALVDDADYAFLMQWRWRRNNKAYHVKIHTERAVEFLNDKCLGSICPKPERLLTHFVR